SRERAAAPRRRTRRCGADHPGEAGPPVGPAPCPATPPPPRGAGWAARKGRRSAAQHYIRRDPSMREVDFRYLQGALTSLNSSTDLVLVRGRIQAVLSHQASPYASRRQVNFGVVPQPLRDDVLLAANYRKILLVSRTEDAVRQATEAIGRDGRPFEGTM